VDGLLSFWVLSAVFAIVGAALKGLIRPLSLATLAIATLFIAPGKMAETFNAIRTGDVKLALPSLPPPPPAVPTTTNSTPTNSATPVPLDPSATPSTRIATPPSAVTASADKGWDLVDFTAQTALPPVSSSPANSPPTSTPSNTSANPPVSGLW
jgi:hypothetical protein